MIGFWCLVIGVALGWAIGYCHGLDILRARRGARYQLPPVGNSLTHAGSQGNVWRDPSGGSAPPQRALPLERSRVLAPASSSSSERP